MKTFRISLCFRPTHSPFLIFCVSLEALLMSIIVENLNKTTLNKIARYVCFHRWNHFFGFTLPVFFYWIFTRETKEILIQIMYSNTTIYGTGSRKFDSPTEKTTSFISGRIYCTIDFLIETMIYSKSFEKPRIKSISTAIILLSVVVIVYYCTMENDSVTIDSY